MTALFEVVVPVFLLIGFGYVAVWRGVLPEAMVEGLMRFAQGIALPCLLFRAITKLDIARDFDPMIFASFYTGATAGFFVGMFGAHYLFRRNWEDSVAIGFCCLFGNTLLLGVPITERAFGPDALSANFALIAIHAPFCYLLGICTMEIVKNKGGNMGAVLLRIGKSMITNSLVMGILAGVVANLVGLPLPLMLTDALDMLGQAGIPAALFGLGGVLYHYRPEGDLRVIGFILVVSLVLHPVVAWTVGRATGLTLDQFRSAVVSSAMPPGINAYLFAHMYGAAKRVSASSVLIATAAAIPTAWFWLSVLP